MHFVGKSDENFAALPIVTAVYFHESFVPSPVLYTKKDGTEVTNFPASLALWAGVDDAGRVAVDDTTEAHGKETNVSYKAHDKFWDGIRHAIRSAEANRPNLEALSSYGPPFKCKARARFGAGPDSARINRQWKALDIAKAIADTGFIANFEKGKLITNYSFVATN